MRKIENWMSYKTTLAFNQNIFYVDLASVVDRKKYKTLSLGYKIRDYKNNAYWQSCETDVEMDFTIDEFINICKKYNVNYSICTGE